MKSFLFFVPIVFSQVIFAKSPSAGSHQGDTVKTVTEKVAVLKEVVIESSSRKEIPQGIAFFPSKRERNLATDAVNLIELMSLTELHYDYRTNSVTTVGGAPVSYFIEGREASSKDLMAMNPKDVEKIEYYPMPTSSDFVGRRNVINYVLKKYHSGGFTRVYAHQILDGRFGSYSLSSRLVYKKATIDGFFDGSYTNANSSGSLRNNVFRDIQYDSSKYEMLQETIDGRDSHVKHTDLGAFVRAIYAHRAIDLTGTMGWNWVQTPHTVNYAATHYNPDAIPSKAYASERSALNINPYLNLITKFRLPNNQSLSVSIYSKYLSERSKYSYLPQGLEPILNGTKGKDWSFLGMLRYSKTINNKNSLSVAALASHRANSIDYSGSYEGGDDFKNVYSKFDITFSHVFNKRTEGSIGVGFSNKVQWIDGDRNSIWNPSASLSLSRQWTDKASMRISSNVFLADYPDNLLNDITLRVSELLWRRGNPELRNRVWWQTLLSNTWTFSNSLSLTIQGLYTHVYNKDFQVWVVDPRLEGVVQTYTCDGATDWLNFGSNITYKMFNRRLVFSGGINYDWYRISGWYQKRKSYVNGKFSAIWYGNKWYIGAVVVPGALKAWDNTNQEQYENWIYRLNVGYNYRNFTFSAVLINPFSRKLKDIIYLESEHFSQTRKNYSCFSANSFRLTATYTISYGKRVSRTTMQKEGQLQSGAMSVD